MRSKKFKIPVFLSWLIFAVIVVSASAQSPAPSASTTAATESPRRRSILDVIVTDPAGAPVAGLSPKDFTLYDKGKPMPLAGFQAVNAAINGAKAAAKVPTEVTIVLDTVNTVSDLSSSDRQLGGVYLTVNEGADDLTYARAQLSAYLRDNPHLDYPITILLFNENGAKPIAPASADGNVLADALAKVDANLRPARQSQGFYGGLERMQLSTTTLSALALEGVKRPGRKLVLWLGRGWPLLQGTDAETDAKQSKLLFGTAVTLSTELRLARMSLYAIDPSRVPGEDRSAWVQYVPYAKPLTTWKEAAIGHLAAQVLAEQSGGLPINSPNAVLAQQIAECIATDSQGYVLLYDSVPATQKDEYRDLKIEVNRPGVKVRTRVGYYAQP